MVVSRHPPEPPDHPVSMRGITSARIDRVNPMANVNASPLQVTHRGDVHDD